jgi:hypothetical protein
MGVVDGQWSCIEPSNEGCGTASNDTWATGPESGSTDFDNYEAFSSFYAPQSNYWMGDHYDDWNQVRYGGLSFTEVDFADKSGFGFDGADFILDPSQPFLLGKFCHFNNPIETDDEMEWVDLNFSVYEIQCDPDADNQLEYPDHFLEFSYRFTLDETPNSPYGTDCTGGFALCPYTIGTDTYCPHFTGINTLGCADKVVVTDLPLTDIFTCYYDGVPSHYTIELLGMVPLPAAVDSCPETPSGEYTYSLISQEESYNCACLYAAVTELSGTGVTLNYFNAVAAEEGLLFEWETASEVDTLGFNIYRSTDLGTTKEKINPDLIPTKFLGTTLSAKYDYLFIDPLNPGVYYFWLESVDISASPSVFYGPVELTLEN